MLFIYLCEQALHLGHIGIRHERDARGDAKAGNGGFATPSHVLTRLALLAQMRELACRLPVF